MQIIEVPITPKMLRAAKQQANNLGKLNNSIRQGRGNTIGFLGELALNELIDGQISNTYDYDLIYRNKVKIDVKTKETTVMPKPFYEASVADYNTKQKCDLYAFGRVDDNMVYYWFCGMCVKDSFYDQATFHRKGDIDPSNNFRFRADCYNLRYDMMEVPSVVLNNAKRKGFKILNA